MVDRKRLGFDKVIIPNTITGASIFAGYVSIAHSLSGNYTAAAWFILLAGFLDMWDGRVARAINATSDFGIQFDSLADAMNYGVAPSLLFYMLYFKDWGTVGIIIGFLPVVCATIRLARYNLEAEDAEEPITYFSGLPTTAAALFLASYVIFAGGTSSHYTYGAAEIGAVFMVLSAILMVSPVRYEKNLLVSPRTMLKNKKGIAGVGVLATVILFPTIAFFFWSLIYIISGLARGAFMIVKD